MPSDRKNNISPGRNRKKWMIPMIADMVIIRNGILSNSVNDAIAIIARYIIIIAPTEISPPSNQYGKFFHNFFICS